MVEKENQEERDYLTYLTLFIVTAILILYILDRFILQADNMEQLKKNRADYYTHLDQNGTIQIGVAWPFFFEAKPTDYFKEGILLAQKELNQATLLGRKVKVIFKDDRWEVKRAKKIAKKFAKNKKVLAVIAHDDEKLAIPASITYEYAGVIMIAPAVSYPLFIREDFNYIFRNTVNDISFAQTLAKVSGELNFKKIVALSLRDDKYAETLAQNFMENAIYNGIEVVYRNKFTQDIKSFSQLLTDLSPEDNEYVDYDAVFIAGPEELIATFISKARKKGIYAPFITGDMLDIPNIKKYGESINGVIVSTLFNAELMNEKTQDFRERFKKEYGFFPDTWAAQGYDAMMLLAQAIKNADSLEPELIVNELKYMKNFESIFGSYSLTPKGDVADKKIYTKVVKEGHFEYIK